MTKLKCILCDSEIEVGILDKPNGTIVKIRKEEQKSENYPVCSSCQKKHKNNLKKEVEKLFE